MSQKKSVLSENLKLAKIVLIACVILTLVVIAPMKLNGKRNDALDVFLNGTNDKYRASVYTDLKNIAEDANRLVRACEKEASADQENVEKLKEAAIAITGTSDPGEMLNAFKGITYYADSAYDSLSESAKQNCYDAYVNLTDVASVIKRDSYFTLASNFNQVRNAFPTSVLAGIFGIDELPTGGK